MKRLVALWLIAAGLLLFIFSAFIAQAQEAAPVTDAISVSERVSDKAGILSSAERVALTRRLEHLEQLPDKPQIAIATIENLPENQTIEEFSAAAFKAWKLGQAGRDNGVLVVLVTAEKKIRIEVGYGAESVLPDSLARGVVKAMTPELIRGHYLQALQIGADQIGAALAKQEVAPPTSEGSGYGLRFALLLFLFVVGIVLALMYAFRRVDQSDEAVATAGLATGLGRGSMAASAATGIAAASMMADHETPWRADRPTRAAIRRREEEERRQEEDEKRRRRSSSDDITSGLAGFAIGAALGSGSSSSSESSSSFSGGGGDSGGGGYSGGWGGDSGGSSGGGDSGGGGGGGGGD
jgi:uncharacterized protein